MHYACFNEQKDVVERLLSANADPLVQDSAKRTAIQIVSQPFTINCSLTRSKTSIYIYVFWYLYILRHVSRDSITPQSFIQLLCDSCSLKAEGKGYTTILDVMKQSLEGVSSAYLQN